MAFGANFYDASGALRISIGDRLQRYYGTYSYSGVYTTTVTVSVPGMSSDGTWSVVPTDQLHIINIGTDQFTVNKVPFVSTANYSDSGTAYVFRV